ncbi:MAG: FAD-dependent oxidoreductase [Pyrinomonadaceae bacterium]|nr:FAD-dependent oxidoreductase [Pyrinomonadaceae bacterium]
MSYEEHAVANFDDLGDGEMKEVSVAGTKILLARVGGNYHAVSAACPHYGAPLAEGVLCGERVICPWHHACFNVTTGDLEEPPALDSLSRFDVKVRAGRVYVRIPSEAEDRRTPRMVNRDPDDKRMYVIIGAGAAGLMAAQTLREDGYRGRLIMVTREDRLPYDRPNLSKDYLQGHAEPEWMPLRADEFFTEHDIEVWRGKEVTRVTSASRTITFTDGASQRYDRLLIASGGAPRSLPLPSSELKNIFLLRSHDDTDAIIEAAGRSRRALVIGASFIGMEAASSLASRGLSVTVVAPDSVPFEKTLGPEVGALFRRLHESQGIEFRLGEYISQFQGSDQIEAVVLGSGGRVETDMVIAGVGVLPATGFLEGELLTADGGVIVDSRLRAAEALYAAGDVASFIDHRTGARTRIEHWRTAQQQGRVAAHNMAGRKVEYAGVPFFWTRQFDAGLLYVGHAPRWDEIIYLGDVSSQEFLAFYVADDRVLAVAGMNRDRDMAAVEELMRLELMPEPAQIGNGSVNFLQLLPTLTNVR